MIKEISTILIILIISTGVNAQYIFEKEYIDINGDTIATYSVNGDNVTGRIKNNRPDSIWTHHFYNGGYMKGRYKGFWGQYIGKWDYYNKSGKLTHSKIYNSKKSFTGWKHTEIVLDSLGSKTQLISHSYKFKGMIDSERTYKINNGKRRVIHKDIYSPLRLIEKNYYDNGQLKSKINPIRIFNIVIYKEYSQEGKLLKKNKEK